MPPPEAGRDEPAKAMTMPTMTRASISTFTLSSSRLTKVLFASASVLYHVKCQIVDLLTEIFAGDATWLNRQSFRAEYLPTISP